MGTFVLQRILQTILVVLAAALISFAMFRYVGDPVNNMVGQAATLAQREAMRHALGLEDPVALQFLRFLRDALSGDLGVSYRFGVPVGRLILERLPAIEPRATVAIAQCLPYGQRLTYWPLRGVLYRLIGVPDDAMAPAVRQAIRGWLDGSGLEAMDREVELLAATVGAGETEVIDRSALLTAWRTFFEIAAMDSSSP